VSVLPVLVVALAHAGQLHLSGYAGNSAPDLSTRRRDSSSLHRSPPVAHPLRIAQQQADASPAEGRSKAVAFLKDLVIADPRGEAYWA
jgi:hypothetical protein